MVHTAWCYRKGGNVLLPWQIGRHILDISGTPCTDYSSSGACAGIYGQTFPILATWCQLQIRLAVALIIHENVIGQDESVLRALLGDHFELFFFEVTPALLGFGCIERLRRYCIGRHLIRTVTRHNPHLVMRHLVEQLSRVVTEPRDVFIAPLEEILEEAFLVAQRRGIAIPAWLFNATDESQIDLTFLLNPREIEALTIYNLKYVARFGREPHEDPNCAFYLGDNPETHTTWSCASGRLPTMRTGTSHFTWIPNRKRWITSKEFAAAMGFPVYPQLARAMNVPLLELDTTEARSFLGNSMHAANLGLIVLVTLVCFRVRDP